MSLEEENDLIRARREKLNRLRELGQDPFALERYDRTHTAAEAAQVFLTREAGGSDEPLRVRVAGRVTVKRAMGKATFLDLRDESGRIQLYFKRDHLGEE